ncbi:hypothetical protein E8E12_010736 [Didymella heteroderae]|uniref:Uncharacterized protein n=1 Tax=Didymella heteroderae TaxID=1769908 RepID=A0A9P4WY01_9PLEO|nr:hypothetical protein E8E12_010736 [Didymella heteroderae]
MKIDIHDIDVDELPDDDSDSRDPEERDYNVLLERLSLIAQHLEALRLGLYDGDPLDHNGLASRFLDTVQSASSFRLFKSLRDLIVPYQCLLGWAKTMVDTVPSPATMLPRTLKYLSIHCPQTYIYDWLIRIRTVRDRPPALSEIELHCQLPFGDEYPLFAFENWDHPTMEVLTEELGIIVCINSRERDWKPDWDDYDMDTLEIIDWLNSLGEHGVMDRLLEWIDCEV